MPQRHNSDSSVTSSHNGGQNGNGGQGYMRYRSKYPPRRPYWSNTPVPPRFERSNVKHYPDIDQDSSCETEELPNGFTKVSFNGICTVKKYIKSAKKIAILEKFADHSSTMGFKKLNGFFGIIFSTF